MTKALSMLSPTYRHKAQSRTPKTEASRQQPFSMDGGHGAIFQYSRLASARSIRVLILEPARTLDAPLQFNLKHIDLDTPSRVQYEALSYVWGARQGSRPVQCDGATILITPTCESALMYLRLVDVHRVLWVDAICIDQSGADEAIKERNAQVALMGQIYAGASRTWCWLGEGTDFTKDVMSLLTKIGECPSQRGLTKLLNFEDDLHAAERLDPEASCLNHLFCHPWHTRMWTVQEVAYSKDCYVLCGHNSMPWPQYSKVAKFLIYDQFIDTLDVQAQRSMIAIDMRTVLVDYLLGQEDQDVQTNLSSEADDFDRRITFLTSCLTDVNKLGAGNPRDKIYAMQAVFIDLGISFPAVDYTSTPATVYTKAAVSLIQWSGTLKVLRDACSLNRLPSLPSWVPDWNDDEIRLYMPDTLSHLRTSLAGMSLSALSPESGKLQIRGHVLGVIDENESGFVHSPFPTRSTDDILPIISLTSEYHVIEDDAQLKLLIAQISCHRELLRNIRQTRIEPDDEDAEEIFYDLLTHGTGEIPLSLFEVWLNILQYPESDYNFLFGSTVAGRWKAADIDYVDEWTEELTHCAVIAASLLAAPITHNGQPLAVLPEIRDLFATISSNLGDQTVAPFRLHGANTLALGTTFCTAKARDQLVWLQGADWPVVLRQVGTEWRFIGPAYVNGLKELLTDDESFAEQCPRRGFVLV